MSSIIQRIAIIGSGNWGSTIAKIVGNNVLNNPKFHPTIKMYVYEEIVHGRKLTEIINKDHENVKYLPGHKLPENVMAIPDVVETAHDADIIVFVLPHQFIEKTCRPLVGKIKPNSLGVSLIKGFYVNSEGKTDLISNMIKSLLQIECCVLMGANLANEVASECFCEATIGCRNREKGQILKEALQTPYFRIKVVKDVEVVEICGALKNIVAVGAGICDGLKYGDNTKAAVIRLGLMEMVRFAQALYPDHDSRVFFESCGVADLITSCYGGRNRRVAERFAQSNKTIEELEAEMLGGQKLQGPETAKELNSLLKSKNMEDQFPLFTTIHKICTGEKSVLALMEALVNHPEHD